MMEFDGASRARNEINEKTPNVNSGEVDPPAWFRTWVEHCQECGECQAVDQDLLTLFWFAAKAEKARDAASRKHAARPAKEKAALVRQAYLEVLSQAPHPSGGCAIGRRLLPASDLELLVGIEPWDYRKIRTLMERIKALHPRESMTPERWMELSAPVSGERTVEEES